MLDRPTLIKRIEAGEKFEFLCFYSHAVTAPVTKTCFSQWYPAPFTVDGVLYPTAEHWMMAGKARLFGDDDALQRILVAPDPKSAKAIGREVRGFDDKVWKENARRLVTEGNVHCSHCRRAAIISLLCWRLGSRRPTSGQSSHAY